MKCRKMQSIRFGSDTSGQSESRLPKIWKRAIDIGSMHRLGEVNIPVSDTEACERTWIYTRPRLEYFFGTTDDHGRQKSGEMYDLRLDRSDQWTYLAANHIALYLDFSRRMDAALILRG